MMEDDLISLLKSGAPIVVVSSWEEEIVEFITAAAARKIGRKLTIWSAASGFRGEDKFTAPLDALLRIRQSGGDAIALLLDFHPHLDDPTCVRVLREIASGAPAKAPQVILSMPVAKVPVELEKEVSYLAVPLPDAKELRTILRESLKGGGKLLESFEERAAVSAAGLTRRQALRVFKLAVQHANGKTDDDFLREILRQKREITRGALALEFRETGETFNDIGGLELLKSWLRSRASAFTDKAREFGLPAPRGLLLLGIQGCGKSLTAKAVSDLWKIPLLRLDLSRIDPERGEEMLAQALSTSEAVAPAVLWIDEIEKGFGRTANGRAGVSLRALSTFITWLQEKSAPVYVVATANSIREMPPELLRKGRFDEIFFVNLPNRDERREIFRIHILKRKRSPDNFDLELLADRCEGFSGAEIEACIVSGMFEAFSANRDIVNEDIGVAIESTVPLSTTMEEEVKALRDWAKGRARPATLDTRLAELLRPQPD